MYCPSCGNEIPDNAKFCDHCGMQIEEKKSEATTQSEQRPEYESIPLSSKSPTPKMGTVNFDPMRWLSESWNLVQSDFANILIFNLIYVVISAILGAIIIGIFAMPGILAGYSICIMKFVREKKKLDPAEMLQSGWDYYVNFLIYMIVAGFLSGLASIFLVIPGMIVSLGFMIPIFMFIDKKSDFNTVFNAAVNLISKHLAGLLIFSILLIVIGITIMIVYLILVYCAWIIAFLLALLVTPWLTIAIFLAYEELFGLKASN